jgi:hypothetical protein
MNPILKNKYVQVVLIVAVIYILYKLLNSDLFKGLGKTAEGVGSAVTGIGEGVGTVATSTANVYKNYAELVASIPKKLGVWTGLISDEENKPWLDLYANLPWSATSVYGKPFFIPSSVYNKGIQRQNAEWIKVNVATPIKNAVGTFSTDEEAIFGAIDKVRTWFDFMTLAERYKPMTNKSLRAVLDEALDESEKVELAKIMNSKPLYTKA